MTKEERLKKIEELRKKANELKKDVDYYNALQLALKLVLNGSYGAWATKYFILYNDAVASTITAEGRELTQAMDNVNQEYWYEHWHLDHELHKNLCIRNVSKIEKNEVATVYGDTDSAAGTSLVRLENEKLSIEDWYNKNIVNGSGGKTLNGHESVLTKDKILNYEKNRGLYFAPVKRIIRHKVKKAKWTLRTKSGKEIFVTNDHSMIVFRDGVQMEVKPSEILKTDKILILKE